MNKTFITTICTEQRKTIHYSSNQCKNKFSYDTKIQQLKIV